MTDTKYTPTIGLEIHAELKTKTKMFCDSPNDPEEKAPNVNICPICMAHPGTLPVPNKEAIRHVLRVGIALNGVLADFTEFDRKNYFYPDIPKGYQISQYQFPLVSGGQLEGAEITRVHLEEDTARSSHDKGAYSLVDFNRAGVPLMELVTEPVIESAEHAGRFARELQLLLRYLGVSDANMEKGEMRVEANISISTTKEFGTKVEVKNLNSFRSVERAIEYETQRQQEVIESGGTVVQETRGWDENKQETFSQRKKESSHDYRYFPDPDLPKLKLSEIKEFKKEDLTKTIPELPWEKRKRYVEEFGIKSEDMEVFVRDPDLAKFFEETVGHAGSDIKSFAKLASNYLTSDLLGLAGGDIRTTKATPETFTRLVAMAAAGELSSRAAKDILAEMHEHGGNPETLAEEKGLLQQNDEDEIRALVQTIIDEHSDVVADYRAGKASALQFLIGQAMKATRGAANPKLLVKFFEQTIGKNP